jgi:hypothetical protein
MSIAPVPAAEGNTLAWIDAIDPRVALAESDPELFAIIEKERLRQSSGIELIASENYVTPAVLAAMGSVLTNKYAEGYPGKRYYGGCEVRRPGRKARHRPRQEALWRRSRQRAAALGRAGQ